MHGNAVSYSRFIYYRSMYVLSETHVAAKAEEDEAWLDGTIATRVNGSGSTEE